jgi:hypothetical protein
VFVTPSRIDEMLVLHFDGAPTLQPLPLGAIRRRARESLGSLREDILRPLNPTPYKVSVSERIREQLGVRSSFEALPHFYFLFLFFILFCFLIAFMSAGIAPGDVIARGRGSARVFVRFLNALSAPPPFFFFFFLLMGRVAY